MRGGVRTFMRIRTLLSLFAVVCMFCMPLARAEDASPYGDYKKGTTDGGYGEKRPVATVEEAKKVLADYFAKKDVRIGEIREQKLFFEAEIKDKNNNLIDKVIIDKRTGRIRSTY
jgi:hypothetical protein